MKVNFASRHCYDLSPVFEMLKMVIILYFLGKKLQFFGTIFVWYLALYLQTVTRK